MMDVDAWLRRGEKVVGSSPEKAHEAFTQAYKLRPDSYAVHWYLWTKLILCDWEGLEELRAKAAVLSRSDPNMISLLVTTLPVTAAEQKIAMELYVQSKFPGKEVQPPPEPGDRIRVGYFSPEIHDHATMHLFKGSLLGHDRSRFEVSVFRWGPDRDEVTEEVRRSVDNFVDLSSLPDEAAAAAARDLRLDIAVDLKGSGGNQRIGIFANHAAPVQVTYLGYPSTTGAKYMDYLIADRVVVPEANKQDYTEKLVYMPGSYQANDDLRQTSPQVFERGLLGLPERGRGIVFCCFNGSWKITPESFDLWMRILRQVPGSVLWLLFWTATAKDNLRREARARGVDPDRLVFTRFLLSAIHRARQRVSDIFLDTLEYNAHTTGSDSLWAEVPVISFPGPTFARRVGASLLNALDLPELIASSKEDYETKAVDLATNPSKLQELKAKLAEHKKTKSLFRTADFTQHLESAYTTMHARLLAGLAPNDICVGE